jgi:hypothetical protein
MVAHVAVIGPDIADTLWPLRDPIDEDLTVDGVTYRVIGVFEHKGGGLLRQRQLRRHPGHHIRQPVSSGEERPDDTIHIADPQAAEDLTRSSKRKRRSFARVAD